MEGTRKKKKKKPEQTKKFSDDRFRPVFCPHYIGVFSQLNCFYWCMKFIDESRLVGLGERGGRGFY